MAKPTDILAICTTNSCRTIIAEALINALGDGRYRAVSAGSSPSGTVHPKCIETLRRHGINPREYRSKSWNEFTIQRFNAVIAICDEVTNKIWPVFPGNPQKQYWHIPDPSRATGTDAEIAAEFDKVFLMLKEKVEELIKIRA